MAIKSHRALGTLLVALAYLFLVVCVRPSTSRAVVSPSLDAGRASAPAGPEAWADCNIWWGEIFHDTFNSNYRSVVGPTTPNTTIKLRLRVAQSDITSARVRAWNDRTNTETYYTMSWDGSFDTDPITY